MSNLSCYDAMNVHLKKYFAEGDIFVFDEIYSPDFHLDVYLIRPNAEREFYTLITSGVSSIPMNVPDPVCNPFIELMLLLPKEWPLETEELKKEEYYWPIELLKDLGRFPHTNRTWLGPGHTIPESKTSYLFRQGFAASVLIQSSTVSEDFLKIPFGNGTIDVLMPLPIYLSEYEYKKQHGIIPLIEKMAECGTPEIAGIQRENAVKG